MIPIYNKQIAKRAGRPLIRGPEASPRRKIHLFHQCYMKLMEGWNAITEKVKVLLWGDGVWRKTKISLAALLCDQPEADAFCCSGSQTCKVCECPKDRLSDIAEFPLNDAAKTRRAVLRAADGHLTGGARLFQRDRRTDIAWKPTSGCKVNVYERTRKQLRGTHIMENAFWRIALFDVHLQVCC